MTTGKKRRKGKSRKRVGNGGKSTNEEEWVMTKEAKEPELVQATQGSDEVQLVSVGRLVFDPDSNCVNSNIQGGSRARDRFYFVPNPTNTTKE